MNKLYMILAGFFLCLGQAFAQTEFASLPVPFRSAEYIRPSVSADGDICLYTYQQGSVYLYHIDNTGQLKSTIQQATPAIPELLGDLPLREKFVYFERRSSGSGEKIQPYYLDKASGKLLYINEIELPLDPRSNLLQAFTSDSTFYAVYYSKKTNTIQVCAFTSAQEYTVKTFNMTALYMPDRILQLTTPVYVGGALENELYQGQFQKKIFLENNKLYFLFDGFTVPGIKKKLTTEVLTLDLTTETSNFSALPYIDDVVSADISSYLYQNALYRYVMTGKDRVMLEVFDAATLNLKKSYAYNASDKVTIQATPLAKTNKSADDTTQTETARSMIQKMHTGVVAVAANRAPANTIELQLGTYDVRNNPANMLPTGANLLSSVGPGALPVMAAMLIIKAAAADAPPKEKNTCFKAYLHAETFEITEPVNRVSPSDLIDVQTNRLLNEKVSIGALATYAYKGNVHYAYLDKKTRLLKIVSLSEADVSTESASSNTN